MVKEILQYQGVRTNKELRDEYKKRKLGYKINTDITDPKKYPYLGIKECLEYDINDDWCQDCNDESGELLL